MTSLKTPNDEQASHNEKPAFHPSPLLPTSFAQMEHHTQTESPPSKENWTQKSDLAAPPKPLEQAALEQAFFNSTAWLEQVEESDLASEGKPLSAPSTAEGDEVPPAEDPELSFFLSGEVDLLNEEDFFFPSLLPEKREPNELTVETSPLGNALTKQAPTEDAMQEETEAAKLEMTQEAPFAAPSEETSSVLFALPTEETRNIEAPSLMPLASTSSSLSSDFSEESASSLSSDFSEESASSLSSDFSEESSFLGIEDERLGALGSSEHSVAHLGAKTLSFYGNYRRFLVQLVTGLLFSSPLTFWFLFQSGSQRPIQMTLALHTILGGVACAIFWLFPYQRRRIILDDVGLSYEDELRILYIPWRQIEAIHLHAVEAFFNPYPLCYVRVVTARGDEIGFAHFGNYLFGIPKAVSFGDPPYPIIDIRDADVLLALLVQRTEGHAQTPDLSRLRFRAHQADAEIEEVDTPIIASQPRPAAMQAWLGLWFLFLKIGTKFLAFLPTGLKALMQSVKPMYAGASLGLYAIFFRWEFALLLCLILIFHELGHVWAMRREGMRIRGVFLIPFFGAATVTDDAWPSWYAQAWVNLAGPLWGAGLTALCMALYLFWPSDFLIAVAIWGALINLLNLLPIHPLDGGRILNAVAYSLRTALGFFVVIGLLVGCVILALYYELYLLYLLSMIGIAEFFKEFIARRRADKFALLHEYETLGARDLLLLKSITGINFGDRNAPYLVEIEEIERKRLQMILTAPRMRSDQIWKIGVASVLVAFLLFAFLLLIRNLHPHAVMAVEIFR
jgi:Zn-dependent protease